MRYAITSDIHANRQAWNAVLLDIRSSNIDKIICLGDIVGYGPDPARVLESVYSNVDFSEPAAFNYVIEPGDALDSWEAVEESLLFIGHTHHPSIFVLGGSGKFTGEVAIRDLHLEKR